MLNCKDNSVAAFCHFCILKTVLISDLVCPIEEAYKDIFALYRMLKRHFLALPVDSVLLSWISDFYLIL